MEKFLEKNENELSQIEKFNGQNFLSLNAKIDELIGEQTNQIGLNLGDDLSQSEGVGLTAQYFDNKDLTELIVLQTDATVDFNWQRTSPHPAIHKDTFSVRWSGEIEALYDETYTFYTQSDDGVRLWVNGELLIDQWHNQSTKEHNGTIALEAGQKYDIKLEYYENRGAANARLLWSSNSQIKEIIPTSQLYSTLPSPVEKGTGTGLTAQYFDNKDLTELIVLQTDATVDFNWQKNSPHPGIHKNTFSVRWTGQVQPLYNDTYTFYTQSDDGVRLWVNGELLIDQWRNQSTKEHNGTIALEAGQKYDIKLEYYENRGKANARLLWSSNSQIKEIIPTSQLYSNEEQNLSISADLVNDTGISDIDQIECIPMLQ